MELWFKVVFYTLLILWLFVHFVQALINHQILLKADEIFRKMTNLTSFGIQFHRQVSVGSLIVAVITL